MSIGFIDMTALTSALGAVRQGKKVSLSAWHDRSLLEVTYLLLHDQMKVIPHLGDRSGEVGDTAIFFSEFPEVMGSVVNGREKIAAEKTKAWVDSNLQLVADAWETAKNNPLLWQWAVPQRELRWMAHSQTYGGLFDQVAIPWLAKLLPESEERLERIHEMSTDASHVNRWMENGGEEARIAFDAWVLSCLIRGKYYEILARQARMQLVSHPLRTWLEKPLEKGLSQAVRHSEEIFVKILVGSALIETSPERRVMVLAQNIQRARRGIEAKSIVLPETVTADKAEAFAIRAAQDSGINGVAKLYRQVIDRFADVSAHVFLGYTLSYWVPHEAIPALNGAAHIGYHWLRHLSPGQEVTRLAFSTDERFRWLSTLPGGRLTHELPLPTMLPLTKSREKNIGGSL